MDNIREKLVELRGKDARCPKDVSNCHDCPYWADDVGCYEDEATADMLIANGVTVQEWIPVTERLPEEDTRVLVWLAPEHYEYTNVDTDRFYRGRWVRWSGRVTHWMPLPSTEGLHD